MGLLDIVLIAATLYALVTGLPAWYRVASSSGARRHVLRGVLVGIAIMFALVALASAVWELTRSHLFVLLALFSATISVHFFVSVLFPEGAREFSDGRP